MSAEQMLTTPRLYMKRHLMGPCRPGPGSTGKTLEERAWWLLAVSLLSVPTMDVVSCGLSSPLDLEYALCGEIKLPTSVRSLKRQESSRKTSTFALLTMPKHLCKLQQIVENS